MTARRAWTSLAALAAVAGGCLLVAGPVAAVVPPAPLLHPHRWSGWLDGSDPARAAVALLETGVLAAGARLALGLVVETAALLTARTPAGRRRRPGRAPGVLRRVLVPAPVAVLVAALLGPALPAGAAVRGPRSGSGGRGAGAVVVMSMEAPSAETTPAGAPSGVTSPVRSAIDPAGSGGQFVVRPGDSLWSEAARVAAAHGIGPSDRRTARYWLALVGDARPHLAPPHRPDLIYPGQIFPCPAWPEPPEDRGA